MNNDMRTALRIESEWIKGVMSPLIPLSVRVRKCVMCNDTIQGTRKEFIVCPKCHRVQEAIVERSIPFDVHVHECIECKYIIGESEWELVPPTILGYAEPTSEETANELIEAFNAFSKSATAMIDAFSVAIEETISHSYILKNAMKVALTGTSLAYGARLESCLWIFRWYWRRRMNKANKAIEQLDVELTAMQKEYPDICKSILIDM